MWTLSSSSGCVVRSGPFGIYARRQRAGAARDNTALACQSALGIEDIDGWIDVLDAVTPAQVMEAASYLAGPPSRRDRLPDPTGHQKAVN